MQCVFIDSLELLLKCLKTKRSALVKLNKYDTDHGIALGIFKLMIVITIHLFINQ